MWWNTYTQTHTQTKKNTHTHIYIYIYIYIYTRKHACTHTHTHTHTHTYIGLCRMLWLKFHFSINYCYHPGPLQTDCRHEACRGYDLQWHMFSTRLRNRCPCSIMRNLGGYISVSIIVVYKTWNDCGIAILGTCMNLIPAIG